MKDFSNPCPAEAEFLKPKIYQLLNQLSKYYIAIIHLILIVLKSRSVIMLFVLTFEPAVQILHCDHSF